MGMANVLVNMDIANIVIDYVATVIHQTDQPDHKFTFTKHNTNTEKSC
jgi:hypothetical protein